jgi:SulP family sulfate permease
VAFGLLHAGTLVRYVSYPVMTGFLSGVATVLVMDQAAQLAGYSSDASTSLGAFVDLVLNIGEFSWNSVLIGAFALVIMIALARTPLANGASLVALVVPSLVAACGDPEASKWSRTSARSSRACRRSPSRSSA